MIRIILQFTVGLLWAGSWGEVRLGSDEIGQGHAEWIAMVGGAM